MIVVESVAEEFAVFDSPPPETVTVLLTSGAAVGDTSTERLICG